MTDPNAHPLPATFVAFRELVHIHLREILRHPPRKAPIHAAALLVVVACEALGDLLGQRQPHELFANRYLSRRGVPSTVGQVIFQALRNGLAHMYGPAPIVVEGLGEIRLVMTWNDGADVHLKGVRRAGRQGLTGFAPSSTNVPRIIALDVESMRLDLDQLFDEVAAELLAKPDLAAAVDRHGERVRAKYTKTRRGDAARAWIDFLTHARAIRTDEGGTE